MVEVCPENHQAQRCWRQSPGPLHQPLLSYVPSPAIKFLMPVNNVPVFSMYLLSVHCRQSAKHKKPKTASTLPTFSCRVHELHVGCVSSQASFSRKAAGAAAQVGHTSLWRPWAALEREVWPGHCSPGPPLDEVWQGARGRRVSGLTAPGWGGTDWAHPCPCDLCGGCLGCPVSGPLASPGAPEVWVTSGLLPAVVTLQPELPP